MQGMSVARWIGIATACARVSPCSVNKLAEASSPSFTIGEKELFRRVSSISLAIPSSLCRTTSTVTGSSAEPERNIVISVVTPDARFDPRARNPSPRPADMDSRLPRRA